MISVFKYINMPERDPAVKVKKAWLLCQKNSSC